MYSEPVRRAAMVQARDTGAVALSGKVKLIQESSEKIQAGFVMYMPIYRKGSPTETLAQRQDAIIGWVGGSFRMDDLMAGLGGERSADLKIRIYDADTISRQSMLFESGNRASRDSWDRSLFNDTKRVALAEEVSRSIEDVRIIFASGYGDAVKTPEHIDSVVLNKPFTLAQLQNALQKTC